MICFFFFCVKELLCVMVCDWLGSSETRTIILQQILSPRIGDQDGKGLTVWGRFSFRPLGSPRIYSRESNIPLIERSNYETLRIRTFSIRFIHDGNHRRHLATVDAVQVYSKEQLTIFSLKTILKRSFIWSLFLFVNYTYPLIEPQLTRSYHVRNNVFHRTRNHFVRIRNHRNRIWRRNGHNPIYARCNSR